MPQDERAGDFLLMKARILDAAGQHREAGKLLTEGILQSAVRPEVAQQAAMLLARDSREKEALDLVDRSIATAPDRGDLLLTRAIVLALIGQPAAEKQLSEVEARWPEWDRPYMIHGLLLERGQRKAEALQKFRIAVALGSQEPAAKCALKRLAAEPDTDRQCACLAGLREFLFAKCG